MYPLVLELAAPDALLRVAVGVTCRVLGFSKQAFYQWKKNPFSEGMGRYPTHQHRLPDSP